MLYECYICILSYKFAGFSYMCIQMYVEPGYAERTALTQFVRSMRAAFADFLPPAGEVSLPGQCQLSMLAI
jgi:hypothetical protein